METSSGIAVHWANEFARIKTYAKKATANTFDVIINVAEDMDTLAVDWYKQSDDGGERIVLYIDLHPIEKAYNMISLATAVQMCNLMPLVVVHQHIRFSSLACCEKVSVNVCNTKHNVSISMDGPVLAPEG
eukprot:452887-Rhodomonas_salina.1